MRTYGLLTLMLSLLLVASCEVLPLAPAKSVSPQGAARLLFYIHQEVISPPDIIFTIDGMELISSAGKTVKIESGPAEISAVKLADTQIFLAEAFVEPGTYNGIKLRIANASMRSFDGRAGL
ncbi:MAG: hypothetical protein WA162_05165, partial [Thermodesulfobacteriota bacterium]